MAWTLIILFFNKLQKNCTCFEMCFGKLESSNSSTVWEDTWVESITRKDCASTSDPRSDLHDTLMTRPSSLWYLIEKPMISSYPDCSSCPVYLNSIGWATRAIWAAVKKYIYSQINPLCPNQSYKPTYSGCEMFTHKSFWCMYHLPQFCRLRDVVEDVVWWVCRFIRLCGLRKQDRWVYIVWYIILLFYSAWVKMKQFLIETAAKIEI